MTAPTVPTREGRPDGRITSASGYRQVVGTGDRRAGRRLVLYVLLGEGPARAGFVAGRGVGGAVARNRARRILKEAWRSMSPRMRAGTRVVFVARPEIAGARMQDVLSEMRELLRPELVVEAPS